MSWKLILVWLAALLVMPVVVGGLLIAIGVELG
jgi:hypothetical protein